MTSDLNPENLQAYSDNRDYLLDELRLLDLYLHREVIKAQAAHKDFPFAEFQGLVLSVEEVTALFRDPSEDGFHRSNETIDDKKSIELAALDKELALVASQIAGRKTASRNSGVYLALPRLAQLFHLSSFEERCLVICLAPEIDQKYGKVYAFLQDDITRKRPCVDLILKLFYPAPKQKLAARGAFMGEAALVKYGLLQILDSCLPLISRPLKVDERIVNFLLGSGETDSRIKEISRLETSRQEGASAVSAVLIKEPTARITAFLQDYFQGGSDSNKNVFLHLYGPKGTGKKELAAAVSRELALPLLIVDLAGSFSFTGHGSGSGAGFGAGAGFGDAAESGSCSGSAGCGASGSYGGFSDSAGFRSGSEFGSAARSFRELVRVIGRETVLQQALLVLDNVDRLPADGDYLDSLLSEISEFTRIAFLLGTKPRRPYTGIAECVSIEIEVPLPNPESRQILWEGLGTKFFTPTADLDWSELAGKFRLTPGQIHNALWMAKTAADWRLPGEGRVTMGDLNAACRAQSNQMLAGMTSKINPVYKWDDLVLPPEQKQELKEICNQVRHHQLVWEQWGFGRKYSTGLGLNVLFSGPPGTGKTMAAEVLANQLQLDLYKIDLSQIVSKYIGETEKNLQRIFAEAETSNAILFFDEADALFGKRSEVKDAHDRYANIETAFLLQKMEEYDGLSILATNLKNNLDEAFTRRLRFIVDFPFPEELHREEIWRRQLPESAPRGSDLDFSFLARNFRISGGQIKNIILSAAFLAAEKSVKIGMEQVILATKRELQKAGKLCLKEDFGEYYEWIGGRNE